jgi:hypothetical protein
MSAASPESESRPNGNQERIDPLPWAEFCCWTMVVLAPILTWVNGPPVSPDQAVVRTAVFTLALTGGIVLRVTQIVRKRKRKRAQNS